MPSVTLSDKGGAPIEFETDKVNGKHRLVTSDPMASGPLPLTAFGDLRVAELSPLFQYSFEYTVGNTELSTLQTAGGGTVTQASGMAVANTSATTGSSADLLGRQPVRYNAGLGGLTRFTALFTTPVAATEQYVGIADIIGSSAAFKNGYMIGFDGEDFGFHRFRNDVKFTVPRADWDDPLDGLGASGATLDPTKLNVFAITYQYLGGGAIKVFFEIPNGDLVLVYTEQYAGSEAEPSVHNPNFHLRIHADNKATTADLTVKTSSMAYFVEGKNELRQVHQPQFASGLITKTAVVTPVAIFSIRNKSTYASKVNFIDFIMERFGVSIEASSTNNLAVLTLVKNGTLGGVPAWADIHPTDSIVEIDIAGTTVTGGRPLVDLPLAGKNAQSVETVLDLKIILNPGDMISFVATSAASATVNASALWKELF